MKAEMGVIEIKIADIKAEFPDIEIKINDINIELFDMYLAEITFLLWTRFRSFVSPTSQ